jgi:hypothetical protein
MRDIPTVGKSESVFNRLPKRLLTVNPFLARLTELVDGGLLGRR